MTRREAAQYGLAAVALLAVGLLAWREVGPFAAPLPESIEGEEPSLSFFLLSDRVTLGFIRVALILLAIYVIVAIPALIAAGRWPKGFGKEGLTIDDAKVVEDSKKELGAMVKERDEWRAVAKRLLAWPTLRTRGRSRSVNE